MKLPMELGMILLVGGFSAGAFAYVQDRPPQKVAHDHHGHDMGPRPTVVLAVQEGNPRLHRAALASLDETRAQIHRLKAHQVGMKTCLEEDSGRAKR